MNESWKQTANTEHFQCGGKMSQWEHARWHRLRLHHFVQEKRPQSGQCQHPGGTQTHVREQKQAVQLPTRRAEIKNKGVNNRAWTPHPELKGPRQDTWVVKGHQGATGFATMRRSHHLGVWAPSLPGNSVILWEDSADCCLRARRNARRLVGSVNEVTEA